MPFIEEPARSPILLAMGGKKRHGKDTVADFLAKDFGFVKIGMSDALHEIALVLDPWIHSNLTETQRHKVPEFQTYKSLTEALGYTEAKEIGEYREFLQILGTDVGREMIDPDIWVNQARKRIQQLLSDGHNVILTATRFPNELELIRELGGTSIWVERPGIDDGDTHASETSVSADDFDALIPNDGSLEQLRSFSTLIVDTLIWKGKKR